MSFDNKTTSFNANQQQQQVVDNVNNKWTDTDDDDNSVRSDRISLPESVRSNDSSSKDSINNKSGLIDIFGTRTPSAEWAYLMPRSRDRATLWYPIVSWVLPIAQPTWRVAQRCIHGFAERIVTDHSQTTDDESHCDNIEEDLAERNKIQAKGRGLRKTGIKHFSTNRIAIMQHKMYLEKNPSLLIIPILTPAQVTNWDGSGYSAIVLVSPVSPGDASQVYREIGSTANSTGNPDDILATIAELDLARSLLTSVIGKIVVSCRDTYKNHPELEAAINKNDKWKAAYQKIREPDFKMTVPTSVANMERHKLKGSEKLMVRKVVFGNNDTNSESSHLLHDAPDPTLLVTKAASNWFKQQGLELLP